jgi:hypothetical protein
MARSTWRIRRNFFVFVCCGQALFASSAARADHIRGTEFDAVDPATPSSHRHDRDIPGSAGTSWDLLLPAGDSPSSENTPDPILFAHSSDPAINPPSSGAGFTAASTWLAVRTVADWEISHLEGLSWPAPISGAPILSANFTWPLRRSRVKGDEVSGPSSISLLALGLIGLSLTMRRQYHAEQSSAENDARAFFS